jgi:hypothetical protein
VREIYVQLSGATRVDSSGVVRPALDVAGNGRFAVFLVEGAEEEREYRLDQQGKLDDATDEELQTLTSEDVSAAAGRLLRKLERDGAPAGGAQ